MMPIPIVISRRRENVRPRFLLPRSFLIGLISMTSNSYATHGPNDELSVALTMAGKSACDSIDPTFAKATGDQYNDWRLRNAEAISRAKNGRYNGQSLESFIVSATQSIREMSENEQKKTCLEVVEWLKWTAPPEK